MTYMAIDLETTGHDIETDRIVEIAMIQVKPDTGEMIEALHSLVYPAMPISKEATEAHGITDEDVALQPRFGEIAQQVQELIYGSVLIGHNLRRFDVPILDRQLREADQAGIDLDAVREIDTLLAWYRLQPRTLRGAVELYSDPDRVEGYHRALSDAASSALVALGMAERHHVSLDQLEVLSKAENEVDRFGKFVYAEDGRTILLNFGKHKGTRAVDHQDYLKWMLSTRATFPREVKEIARRILYQPSML